VPVALALSLSVGTASADIVFDGSPGTAAPPATLGPYAMTAFGLDPQPEFEVVPSVVDPAGTVGFAPSLFHLRVGVGWATWSHGYAGDVYWTLGELTTTMSLPPDTVAFYLYAEPNPFGLFEITAVTQDGTQSGPILVDGFGGATYFGFYATGTSTLASITVSSVVDFAVGEFAIATNRPPDCSTASVDQTLLWPPNHKYRSVTVGGVTDPDGDPVTVTIDGVTQDEPTNGRGDGDQSPDAAAGSTSATVQLRAERSGTGDGRVYEIGFTAADDKGASCKGGVTVGVPHDRGSGAATASTPRYDSFVP
jgi:hypothetical protein